MHTVFTSLNPVPSLYPAGAEKIGNEADSSASQLPSYLDLLQVPLIMLEIEENSIYERAKLARRLVSSKARNEPASGTCSLRRTRNNQLGSERRRLQTRLRKFSGGLPAARM